MMEICAIVYFTYVVMKILVQTGISLGAVSLFLLWPQKFAMLLGC